MNTSQVTYKAIAAIGFCFFLSLNYLAAQNKGSYKYIVFPNDETRGIINLDVVEVNNRFYLLADEILMDTPPTAIVPERTPSITVLDEFLNITNRIELFKREDNVMPLKLFYEKNHFYTIGNIFYNQQIKLFFAKFDENFNLVQPLSIYPLDDTLWYDYNDVIMTKKNDFICMASHIETKRGRLFHINNNGEILQDVFLLDSNTSGQSIAETDRNYFVEIGKYAKGHFLRFCKDSLNKVDILLDIEKYEDSPEGMIIAVGNQLIRSNTTREIHQCGSGLPFSEYDRSIVFLDEDMNIQNRLVFGNPCFEDRDQGLLSMHYINSDSIYYAYLTDRYNIYESGLYTPTNISIANFSKDGQLNFNHVLDIKEDTLGIKFIFQCKAISNGGVLVCGYSFDWGPEIEGKSRGFLLLYHPTIKNVSMQEPSTTAERKIYPNPTQLQFTVTNTENATIQLFNMLGQEVLQVTNTEGNTVINVDFLPQGIYVLKVLKDNNPSVHKIQIVK